ncbi:eukaryotic translation initiation factor 2-alpha kinase-like isoform X2 [Leptopilina heterotoma]|uniref:eukaryotic translation initiation factor 2-alpha kinase-like isoform X2 n=1 Tax=Leptopilina heterotoma TaxID=63436 RepID=UPI001CA9B7B8|nr:eukaryotic translation initiation factor 2-alpha kinase-like isoform X2 [Leptopilina heterotoma]
MYNLIKWTKAFNCLLIILGCYVFVNTAEIRQLPFCDHATSDDISLHSFLFVSTLDGKVSALNAADQGRKAWTLDLGKDPMLSSNIHQRELNNHGQWVRLIPSLNGGLYKFDGENLEAVPLSADQLLKSSFRYSDLVFSGGKETRSYGVAFSTGEILYTCDVHGCKNTTDGESYMNKQVLIIQRHQQTIRAVESQSGHERWNFSVGQHGFSLPPKTHSNCHKRKIPLDIEIKVIIPEGLVWAVDKNNPTLKLWEHKFSSPIVTIWQEDDNNESEDNSGLKEINLFENNKKLSDPEFSMNPGLYLGMHNMQLYVQENPKLKSILDPPVTVKEIAPMFPWKPYPAIEEDKERIENNILIESNDDVQSTALSVLYSSNYINGNGFFLYSKQQLFINSKNQCNNTTIVNKMNPTETQKSSLDEFEENEEDTSVPVIIISLWYWWKEVLLISITTAIILNFMLTQSLFNATAVIKDALLPPCIIETHIEKNEESQKAVVDNGGEFISRFLSDYEPVDCLGKGGYGIVFEAKNKVDECNYAIKRITLPNSRTSRERVMREVRALAKLDHQNVVRYFNAWIECPPVGWQEELDQFWINKNKFPGSDFISSSYLDDVKSSTSIHINVAPSDQSSVDSAFEALKLNDKDNDSFIVFQAHESDQLQESEISREFTNNYASELQQEESELSKNVEELIVSKVHYDSTESIVFQTSEKRKASESLNIQDKKFDKKSAKMFLYIQMQLCKKMSLREWLKEQNKSRDTTRVLNIFQQIVNAVEYVHLQGLIHRDLKPSNIFLSFDKKVKIGDFGLVAMTESSDEIHTPCDSPEVTSQEGVQHTAMVGTRLYMSPEQMDGKRYNYKVDIYSLGIILFELLTPFSTEMERVVALTNLRNLIFPETFQIQCPTEFSLLKMMLDCDPSKRPTTLGIRSRLTTSNKETKTNNELNADNNEKFHFDWPQMSRNSSGAASSNTSSNTVSWEFIS